MSVGGLTDLDELDQGIIKMLSEDASLSNTALAQALGVAKTTIGTRVKKLAEQGVMQVIAETDVLAAGYQVYATLAIVVRGRSVAEVAADLIPIPEAIVVNSILGRHQLLIQLIARDNTELLELVEKRIASIDGVAELRTTMSLRILRYASDTKGGIGRSSALGAGDVESRLRILEKTALADRVDALDLRIISFLQQDGRLSLREIARQVGVSEGTVRARVKRLDQEKLLRRVAAVEPLAVGVSAHAFLSLRVEPRYVSAAAEALTRMPLIGMVAVTVGAYDLLAVVGVDDRQELAQVINEEIAQIEGVHVHEVAEVVETFKHDLCWTVFVD